MDSPPRSGIASPKRVNRMLYAVTCTGKPDSLALRMANRPAHVAYLQSLGDGLVMAGPFGCNGHCVFSWPIVPHVIAKKPSNSIVF